MGRRHLLVARDQCDMRGSDGAARDYATHTRGGQSLDSPERAVAEAAVRTIWYSRARQTYYVPAGGEEEPMREPDHARRQLRLALTPIEAAHALGCRACKFR